jgi:hypothetical protein
MAHLLTEQEYAAESKVHRDWLNWVFGITTFLYAVAALQFPSPWKMCLLGLALWIPMYIHAFTSIPSSLGALRQLASEGSGEAKDILRVIESRHMGLRAVLKAFVLWASWILYISVLLSFFGPPYDFILWFQR